MAQDTNQEAREPEERDVDELFEGSISEGTPYDELDPNIVNLVRALNEFPGIATSESCGGHGDDIDGKPPLWQVWISVETEEDEWRPTAEGWLSLEFITYAMRSMAGAKTEAFGFPPQANFPSESIYFVVEGSSDPDDAAAGLLAMKAEIYDGMLESLRSGEYFEPDDDDLFEEEAGEDGLEASPNQ